ncbi:hypothetical protein Tsubulata_040243, partial [Turnera subulata]
KNILVRKRKGSGLPLQGSGSSPVQYNRTFPVILMLLFTHHSRQRPSSLTRHLSSVSSKLHDYYSFKSPPSLSLQEPNPNLLSPRTKSKKEKPPYRPPSLDPKATRPIRSDLPFDFRYSYTESSPEVRPIGLREPKYSPFGPGRLDRSLCPGRGAKGRDGLTHNMLNDIHNHWKHGEAVRIKCLGVPTVDMKNVCTQLEAFPNGRTRQFTTSSIDLGDFASFLFFILLSLLLALLLLFFTMAISLRGFHYRYRIRPLGRSFIDNCGLLILYRGRNYPKKKPVIPLMMWRPHEPIYPRLIRTTIDGLSIKETKEMRKRGLAVPPLTKLAKNGYYGSLVPMVRDAFLVSELVRIDCRGLDKSDDKKIGCKLRDLVPCILVTFAKEQIVVWRGKDYKPIEDEEFFPDRELFNDMERKTVDVEEKHSSDEISSEQEDYSSDEER